MTASQSAANQSSNESGRESAAVPVSTSQRESEVRSSPPETADEDARERADAGVTIARDGASSCEDLDASSEESATTRTRRRVNISKLVAYGVLPAMTLLLAITAGFLKWQSGTAAGAQIADNDAVIAAKDSTVALLSYKPESVEKDLGTARDRLTGTFRDSYTQLTNDVVIPGAKQQQISAVATVPAAAVVSATPSHAVVLVFVNQTAVIGTNPPTDTASSVKVTLEKTGGRWLISGFDPV